MLDYKLFSETAVYRVMAYIGVVLLSSAFILCHADIRSSQSMLSYLVFILLPFGGHIFLNGEARCVKTLVLLFVFLFISSFVSYGFSNDLSSNAFRPHWIYLLSIGAMGVVLSTRPSSRWMLLIIAISLLGSTYVVFSEITTRGTRGSIEHGAPIFFGNLSLLSGIFCFWVVGYFIQKKKWLNALLLFIGLFLGILASIWSETRGGWLYFSLFMLIVTILSYLSIIPKVYFWISLGLTLTFLSFVLLIDKGQRLGELLLTMKTWLNGSPIATSAGLRIEFWKVAWETGMQHPIFGAGYSGFMDMKAKMVADGLVLSDTLHFKHAHNDLLWIFATQGLVGITALLSLYGWLLRYYFLACRSPKFYYHALIGITIVTGFFIFGLSESFLSLKLGVGYFVISNCFLVAWIERHRTLA